MSLKTAAAIWSLACTLACAPNFVHAQDKRVFAPGSTVPLTGMAFGGIGDSATPVTPANPFPVTCISGCSGGTGGGGGAVTVADGADAATGAKLDPAWSGTGSGSVIAILKSIRALDASIDTKLGSPLPRTLSTPYFNAALAATPQLVSVGPRVLADYYLENPDVGARACLQVFNAASAGAVTVGTTVPVRAVCLGPEERANLSALRLDFSAGIVIAATSTPTGSGAPATALVVNLGTEPRQ